MRVDYIENTNVEVSLVTQTKMNISKKRTMILRLIQAYLRPINQLKTFLTEFIDLVLHERESAIFLS